MNHYVYYSYEAWGRGYIGSRSCECLPEEDTLYFGSFHDLTFNPSDKVILLVTGTRTEANAAEIMLHDFYGVDENPHFANKARATSSGFYRSGPHSEETIAKIRRNRKGKGMGPSKLPREHHQAIGRVGGVIGSRNQSVEDKRKGGVSARDLKLGFFALSEEENLKKAQRAAQTTNSLRYRCTVTGRVSTPGGLARWQRARGIDTTCREKVYDPDQGV
jgi:hypothetical protein